MIDIRVDTHTHTVLSGGHYGRIEENALQASAMGIEALISTERYTPMFANVARIHANLREPPRQSLVYGVRVLPGAELEIADPQGHLAGYHLPVSGSQNRHLLRLLEETDPFLIATVNPQGSLRQLTRAQRTKMYHQVLLHPKVTALGHCPWQPFDLPEIVSAAAGTGTLLELSESALHDPNTDLDRCRRFIDACGTYGAMICVGSNARSVFHVGKFPKAVSLLEEMQFPRELVANPSLRHLQRAVQGKRQKFQSLPPSKTAPHPGAALTESPQLTPGRPPWRLRNYEL